MLQARDYIGGANPAKLLNDIEREEVLDIYKEELEIVLFSMLAQIYKSYIDVGLEVLGDKKDGPKEAIQLLGIPMNRETRKKLAKSSKASFRKKTTKDLSNLGKMKRWIAEEEGRMIKIGEPFSFMEASQGCLEKMLMYRSVFPDSIIQTLEDKTRQLQFFHTFLLGHNQYEKSTESSSLRESIRDIVLFVLEEKHAYIMKNMEVDAKNEDLQEALDIESSEKSSLGKELQSLTRAHEKLTTEDRKNRNTIASLGSINTELQRRNADLTSTNEYLVSELQKKQDVVNHYVQMGEEGWGMEDMVFLRDYRVAMEKENTLLREQREGFLRENERLALRVQSLESHVELLVSQSDTSVTALMSRVENNFEICSTDDLIGYMLHVDCSQELKNETVQVILGFFDVLLRETTGGASSSTKGNPGIGGGSYSNNFLKPIVNFLKEQGKNNSHPQVFLDMITSLDWKKIMGEYMGHEGKHKNQMVFSVHSTFPDNKPLPLLAALRVLADNLLSVSEPGVDLIALSENIYHATEHEVIKRRLQDITKKAFEQKRK